MRPPAARVRSLLARGCTARTMARIVDPAVADLQAEHADALAHGRRWAAAWIRAGGYIAIARAMALHGGLTAMDTFHNLSDDERQAVTRTVTRSALLFVTCTLLLAGRPVASALSLGVPGSRELAFGFFVNTLPLVIPVSITLGILWGCGLAPISRRTQVIVLVLALGGALVSFAVLDRITPATNIAFSRTMMMGRAATTSERAPTLRELTSSELRQRIAAATRTGSADESVLAHHATLLYHARFAQAAASLVLAIFAVAFVRWPRRLVTLAVAGTAAIAGYIALAYLTRSLGVDGTLSPLAAAWTPNAILLMLTMYVTTFRSHSATRVA